MGKSAGLQTILGANGTIGAPLAKELGAYADRIRLVSRNPKKANATDELFPADLSDPDQVERAIAGSSIVYLMVGFDYSLKVWQDRWPKLMRSAIDACIKHKAKLVFFDNVYMYDRDGLSHMTEATAIRPPSKKGAVRKEIAEMLMEAAKAGKLRALIARSADFYGPGNDKSFLLETVYKNLKKGKKANWFINADKKHSFTFTPDAAKATALLGNTEDAYGQVWHLPTDPKTLTVREMTALFLREMGGPEGISILPMWLIKVLGLFIPIMREMPEMMYQYDRDYVFDSGKFTARFGISATPYAQGVKATVAPSTGP
jgi:nucleoside-diphosphate-sugar epimerase